MFNFVSIGTIGNFFLGVIGVNYSTSSEYYIFLLNKNKSSIRFTLEINVGNWLYENLIYIEL